MRSAMKNGILDLELLQVVEPRSPDVFQGNGHTAYKKEDLVAMYKTLWDNFNKLKALYDELNIRTSIYEKKLKTNEIDVSFDEKEANEYMSGAKSLIRSSTQLFKEQLDKELGTYNDEINMQITTQLNQAMISFKNQQEYSILKVNHQIDLLESQLEKTYNTKLPIIEKNRMIIALSSELRQQYVTKEKFMGRDIQKTAHFNINKAGDINSSSTNIDWKEMKKGVVYSNQEQEGELV
jgi:hypothetical protein